MRELIPEPERRQSSSGIKRDRVQGRHCDTNSVANLQQVMGNRAVQRLLQRESNCDEQATRPVTAPHSILHRVVWDRREISASIRRIVTPSTSRVDRQPPDSGRDQESDEGSAEAIPGAEQAAPAVVASGTSAPTASPKEPKDGETITLPDITTSPVDIDDAIAGALTHNPSINRGGPTPPPFGITRSQVLVSGISVTPAPGVYNVRATVDQPILYQVTSGGKTNIASPTDSSITQDNYNTVSSDLTPNTADLDGRPPRTQFWAEDLCLRHEQFHANERKTFGRSAVTVAQNWLSTRVAASVAAVKAFVDEVPDRVRESVNLAMPYPEKEKRAYGDGAPLYKARADAIKAKGDAAGYPTLSRGAKAGIGIGGGALVGAGVGALFGGPVGAAVGAGIGAVVGGLGSLLF